MLSLGEANAHLVYRAYRLPNAVDYGWPRSSQYGPVIPEFAVFGGSYGPIPERIIAPP